MQKSEKDLSEEALDALRLEKQSYLRKEIVEVGYDPFIFQNYLDNLKKGGSLLIYPLLKLSIKRWHQCGSMGDG
jgi:hypothetical protein